jgi:hypothetical protein
MVRGRRKAKLSESERKEFEALWAEAQALDRLRPDRGPLSLF